VAVRRVLTQPHLLDDDLLLKLELGLVEDGVDADVGHHLDGGDGARRREHRVVVREVERRSGVHPSADPLDVVIDEALRTRGGPLEEHVLEIMGQPELVRGLVATAGAHPQLDCDDFTRGVLLNEDADAVEQHGAARRFDGGG